MNRLLFLVAISFLILLSCWQPSVAQKAPSAEYVLRRAANKLAAVKLLGYRYKFEYSYPARNSHRVVTANAYLDFQPVDKVGGFKFQFAGDERLSIYNGSERFTTDKTSKKLWVESSPTFDRVGDIFLQNSPLSLKAAFPRILRDKKIPKKLSLTSMNGRSHYQLEFSLQKAAINAEGEIVEVRIDQLATYRVTLDRRTFLPVEVVQTNDLNDESLKTTFSEITVNPARPQASSWYFSTYKGEYQLERVDKLTLIERGATPPNFSLAGFGSTPQTSLDQYKGKLVLIEFWIAQCGFCIAAVPKLNALSQRFADSGLKLISINMHDAPSTIEFFRTRNKPIYMILRNGDSVAKAYGVDAYPAFVLVSKDGKVVYSSSGLEEKELEAAIAANL